MPSAIENPSSVLRNDGEAVWAVDCFNAKKEGNGPTAVSGGGSVYGEEDFAIRVWDLTTNAVVARLKGHTGSVDVLHVFEDATTGRLCLASGSRDGAVMVWDLEIHRRIKVMEGNTNPVESICSFVDGGAGAGVAGAGAEPSSVGCRSNKTRHDVHISSSQAQRPSASSLQVTMDASRRPRTSSATYRSNGVHEESKS